ncbi:D-amino acid dehydrogenase [Modicisalibacter luteus]|uniref:D-amino acid dehydrogenase n=1 Tax=Modicisalibacter luteus TaxID=453962 RepID=A0ABV7LZK0_9GAMM|nr:D-amino acid dehydrogenase [Halomonas lutea]GHA97217.1 D-amino acid dehydrogenase small subunit [Halomonas lutea]
MTQRITVVGAGIVGLTTALALHDAGYEVRVVDPALPGSGTSAANGGQLSWAFVAPLAEPDVPTKLLGWLLHSDSPLRWVPSLDPALPAWGLAFLRACRRKHALATTRTLLTLAEQGRPLLADWRQRLALDIDWRANGKLIVYRDAKALDAARHHVAFQRSQGVEQEILGRDALYVREPALARHGSALAGAVWTPGEEVGDCAACCRGIAEYLKERDVPFEQRRIERLEAHAGRLVAWHFNDGERETRRRDEVLLVAAGLSSRALLASAGLHLPLYPLKGYSLTVDLTEDDPVFDASVTDALRKIVFARLGRRLRIAGMADLDGWQPRPRASRVALLKRQAADFLPAMAERIHASDAWTGLRPATPDGKPRLGPTAIEGLWLNAGHGALGWTLSMGSAQAIRHAFEGDDTALAPFRLDSRRN